MSAYYNEFEPYAAQWLRNLIKAGHIPEGEVDERSITEVEQSDLRGFRQCHFFAGIGGWAYALRLAGWPDDREIWTGSPPCQPFSVIGRQEGFKDSRDLWPVLATLVRERRPAAIMGEQVAEAIAKHWIDRTRTDLEGAGYAFGATVQPACAVNAPHRRNRIWFIAERDSACEFCGYRFDQGWLGRYGCPNCEGDGLVDNGECEGLEGYSGHDSAATGRAQQDRPVAPASGSSNWGNAVWVIGHDGKARRVEPSIRLLAHGVPARVGKLRAYGNAIVPQVAAEVISAYMDCRP